MAKQTDFTIWVAEQLMPLGAIMVRSMFGGFGIYFKADSVNRERFEGEGCQPFRYQAKGGTLTELSYFAAPEAALDDQAELLDWARSGLDAALRARAGKRKKQKGN